MVKIILTHDNIQEIGEKYKDCTVTLFYCKSFKEWVEYPYKIIGNEYHNIPDKYSLNLKL